MTQYNKDKKMPVLGYKMSSTQRSSIIRNDGGRIYLVILVPGPGFYKWDKFY